MNFKKTVSDLKKLKLFLIFFTFLYIAYIFIFIFYTKNVTLLGVDYSTRVIVEIFFVLFKAYFIWFIWKKYPQTKQGRLIDSLMVFFLGVIGMWLWMPNKIEREKFLNTNFSN